MNTQEHGRARVAKKLLIADEEDKIRAQFLKRFGDYGDIELLVATTVREVLQYIDDGLPDAMILDLGLPYSEEDEKRLPPATSHHELLLGIDLLHQIRHGDEYGDVGKTLWVTVITAHGMRSVVQRVQPLLGNHGRLFFKPFDTHIIEILICDHLNIPCQLPQGLQELVREEIKARGY